MIKLVGFTLECVNWVKLTQWDKKTKTKHQKINKIISLPDISKINKTTKTTT